MSKKYQGWYKTIPRGLPEVPPLPKAIGKEFAVKEQPDLPHNWPLSKVNFVGSIGKCVFVRRQPAPPYLVIYQLEIKISGSESPLYWEFVDSQIEEVTPNE